MKSTIIAALFVVALAAFAAETSTVQITHISPSEVGFRCTNGGKMKAREVADMTIIGCSPKSSEPPKAADAK